MDYAIYLSTAATIGDIDAAIDAVKHGADVNQQDGQALIDAIAADDLRMVHALVQLGANVNQPQGGLWGKPLAVALEHRHTDIALYLVEHGANRHEAAIDLAIKRNRTDYLSGSLPHAALPRAHRGSGSHCPTPWHAPGHQPPDLQHRLPTHRCDTHKPHGE